MRGLLRPFRLGRGSRRNPFRTATCLTAGAVAALGLTVGPASAQTDHAAASTWQVASVLGLGAEDNAVSCPDVSLCWAVEGGALLASGDGGVTWTDHGFLVPPDVAAFNDVDCPGIGVCYFTATRADQTPEVVVIDQNGVTERAVPATQPLPTISCSRPARCMTTDGATVYMTTDGGASWTPHSLPRIVYSFAALGCVHATHSCWITGDNGETPIIEATSNDGAAWTLQNAPATSDGIHDVTCPSVTVCYAVGADFSDHAIVIGTTNGGSTWSFQTTPFQAYPLRSVSCATLQVCWASGQDPGNAPYVFATTNGSQWDRQDLPSQTTGTSPDVSCPTTDVCSLVIGGLTFATSNGGADWTQTEVPTAVGAPQALSCPSAGFCVGVANDVLGRPASLLSSDGGTTWARTDMPAKAAHAWDVDCPSASMCIAITGGTPDQPSKLRSHALWSTDGGATWHFGTLDDASGVLTELTCPTETTCLAEGFGRRSAPKLMRTTDAGRTWQSVAAPEGAFYLEGISCASATACVLITQVPNEPSIAWTTDDLGATYQQHALPDLGYFDVGCAGSTCVAVGSNGGAEGIAASRDGGVTWRSRHVPSQAGLLGQVTCDSAAACAATGYDYAQGGGPVIVGTIDHGRSWQSFTLPARQQQPIGVACHRQACVASDYSPTGNPIILAGPA